MAVPDELYFDALLARASRQGDDVEFRFFSGQDPEKLARVVRVHRPSFDLSEATPVIGEEVAVAVRGSQLMIRRWVDDAEVFFSGQAISMAMADLDVEDYRNIVDCTYEGLKRSYELLNKLHRNLRIERDKIHALGKLMGELLRRAEIKAAASEELKVQQASAIAVLLRLIRELETTPYPEP